MVKIMWEPDPKRSKQHEDYFRENAEGMFDGWWNNPSNLKYFSKDFIREFKDKFWWDNTENKVILRLHGNEFYKEIIGENYKI